LSYHLLDMSPRSGNVSDTSTTRSPEVHMTTLTTTTLNDLAGTYTIDPSHTRVGFSTRHAMITKVRGAFNEVSGAATTGPGLQDASIELTVQAGSVDTRSADRDGHLRSADFFDVETYPVITFRSTQVEAVDA